LRRRGHRICGTSRSTFTAGAPASQPATCRLVRVMTRELAAISSAWGEQARLAPSRKMPLTNLCSRLFVTGARRTPRSRAWSLHSADPRDLHRASNPAHLYRTRHDPSTRPQASRCRHHLPRVASRFGADVTSCDPVASTLRDAWSPKQNSYGRCRPLHELRTARPLTLRSPPELPLVAQSQPEGLEPFPHAMHQHRGFPDSETPSTHGSWRLYPLAGTQGVTSRQRTTPGFAHPDLPFDTRSRTAAAR
jgi:hypothetical protein